MLNYVMRTSYAIVCLVTVSLAYASGNDVVVSKNIEHELDVFLSSLTQQEREELTQLLATKGHYQHHAYGHGSNLNNNAVNNNFYHQQAAGAPRPESAPVQAPAVSYEDKIQADKVLDAELKNLQARGHFLSVMKNLAYASSVIVAPVTVILLLILRKAVMDD